MSAKILDGKKTAEQILQRVANEIKKRNKTGLISPGLAVVIVGDNPASKIYVQKKRQVCQQVGIISHAYDLPADTSQEQLLQLIDKLNNAEDVHGILIQLPLPKHIDAHKVMESINPDKDVDGFHPYNLGLLAAGKPGFAPCTPRGIMTLLQENIKQDLAGIDAVIIGHSNIVGKPMALELLNANATVAVCHIFTKDIKQYISQAELLIVAAGVPELVKGKWIKLGAIVVDVGANVLPNGKLVGDVEFAAAKERAGWITPVPGGVGPMTIATLMENTLLAAANLCGH